MPLAPAVFDLPPSRVFPGLCDAAYLAWRGMAPRTRHLLDPVIERLDGTSIAGLHPDRQRKVLVALSLAAAEMTFDLEVARAPYQSRLRVIDGRKSKTALREIREQARAAIMGWLDDPAPKYVRACRQITKRPGYASNHQAAAELVWRKTLTIDGSMCDHEYIKVNRGIYRAREHVAHLMDLLDVLEGLLASMGGVTELERARAAAMPVDPDWVPSSQLPEFASQIVHEILGGDSGIALDVLEP